MDQKNSFNFVPMDQKTVLKMISDLSNSKASPKDALPTYIIQQSSDIFSSKVLIDFEKAIRDGVFPDNMKLAHVSPIFKKDNHLDKSNYRSVSNLSAISKIFERSMFVQINGFMDTILSSYQCGFRKTMNTQNCLLFMIEKWKILGVNMICSVLIFYIILTKTLLLNNNNFILTSLY